MNEITKDGNSVLPNGYSQWRKDIETLIDTAKLKTALSVNMGTLSLYWNIGKSILQKQEQEGWANRLSSNCQRIESLAIPMTVATLNVT